MALLFWANHLKDRRSWTCKLLLTLVFLLPFQTRFYKLLKSFSLSLINPAWSFPAYFEPNIDFFISDIILLLLLGWSIYQKKLAPRLLWQEEQKYLTLFLVFMGASILMHDLSSYFTHYWRWGHFIIASLIAYYSGTWIGGHFKSRLHLLAKVVILSCVLECAVALPQYFFQHHLGLKFIGEPSIASKHVQAACFRMPKKALTSIDYVLSSSHEPSFVLRATGTLAHPNILGGFLVFSLVMTYFLYEKNLFSRKWLSAALTLQVITLFTSYSRASLFAFCGATAIWLVGYYLKERKLPQVWKTITFAFFFSILLFLPQLCYRGGLFSYNDLAKGSDVMRISMQNSAFQIIRDHPWVGVGFNNYLIAFSKCAANSSVQPSPVHNIYLLIAAEMGIVGLALFVAFCTKIFIKAWNERGSIEGLTLLVLLLAFLAIGAVDCYPLASQQMRLIFFLIVGAIASFREVREPLPIAARA